MKRALAYREYRDAKPFQAPDGIVSIDIDPQSGMPATPYCPVKRPEVYIVGTQPVGACPLHGGGRPGATNVAGWETPSSAKPASSVDDSERATGSEGEVSEAAVARRIARQNRANTAIAQSQAPPQQPKKEEKKGFFRRLWGVFK
jgi:membrane carboxypeptidase/penicillin-binding protein